MPHILFMDRVQGDLLEWKSDFDEAFVGHAYELPPAIRSVITQFVHPYSANHATTKKIHHTRAKEENISTIS